nr:hypothetical protein [uncultured Anaerotignum sp.]
MIRVSEIKLPITSNQKALEKRLAKALRVPVEELKAYRIFKRSLDARKKDNIHYVYVVDVEVKNEHKILEKNKDRHISRTPDLAYSLPKGKELPQKRPVVVGFGPAGMFAGLLLAEMGFRPIVLERGGDVDSRKQAVEAFWRTGRLDVENNVQFGEGGAGTFSDGKLTTRIKDPRCRKVLEEMVEAGAPEEILYDAKPHIGTDLLRGVVKNIREKIISLGGEVRFFTKVTGFVWERNRVQAVVLQNGEKIETDEVVLALGHSARDTFTLLHEENFALEQKPFAMGVRIEHPQEMIDAVQYGEAAELLPTADYRLTYTTTKNRGVYTFCMCPGGYVVAAASEEGRLAINGMSEHARDGKNANSALLVQIFPEDFGSKHPLAGMFFQRELEEKAFLAGGGNYTAPVQTVGSFLGKEAAAQAEVEPTYRPAVRESNLEEIFPPFMTEALKEALPAMARRLKGFDRADALLTAVESRSSSPIRILREQTGMSLHKEGVYPAGEGAGYAGGIVSAAVDGIYVAEKIAEKYGRTK